MNKKLTPERVVAFAANIQQEELRTQLAEAKAEIKSEKKHRVYYQDIVYSVCNTIDHWRRAPVTKGTTVCCGTASEPTDEVQRGVDAMQAEIERLKSSNRKLYGFLDSLTYDISRGATLSDIANVMTAASVALSTEMEPDELLPINSDTAIRVGKLEAENERLKESFVRDANEQYAEIDRLQAITQAVRVLIAEWDDAVSVHKHPSFLDLVANNVPQLFNKARTALKRYDDATANT